MLRKLALLVGTIAMGAVGVAAPAGGGVDTAATPLVIVAISGGTPPEANATTSPGIFKLTITGCNILNLGSGGPVKIAVALINNGGTLVAGPQVFDALPIGTIVTETFNVPAGLAASPPSYSLEAVCYRENNGAPGPDTGGTDGEPDGTDFTEPTPPSATGGVGAQAVGDDILGVGSLDVTIRGTGGGGGGGTTPVTPLPALPSVADLGAAVPVFGTPSFTG